MTTTTDLARLRTTAEDALRLNDNDVKRAAPKLARALIDNANRPLLIALVADYLTRLPPPAAVVEAAPQPTTAATASTPRAPTPPPAAQLGGGKGPVGRRREGPKRRGSKVITGMPTAAQRAGAVAARKVIASGIFARKIRGEGPIGRVQVHRLRAIAEAQASTSASFLQRGYDDAVEAIACMLLNDHCVAADPFAMVQDVIPAKKVSAAFEAAKVRAAEVIRDGSAKVARDLIASAREPQQIEDART